MFSLYISAALLVVFVLFRIFLRHLRAHSIKHLPGPPTGPWLVGNMPALIRPKESGDAEFAWTREYGTALCIKGTFGRNMLFTSDPKALQHILNTSAYNFPKPPEARAAISLTAGKGLVWAEGMQHARQRKIMNPAFSYGALRGFLPVFHYTAQQTIAKLKEYMSQTGKTSAVVDIPPWLARATLDAIGIAAFDYQFRAIDEGGSGKLSKAYSNLFVDTFLDRSDGVILFEALWGLVPEWLFALLNHMPTRRLQRLRNYMNVSEEVARTLLDRQAASQAQGKEGPKDVMSILIRANLSQNPRSRLRDDEILPQLTTLFLAGHETTASTLSWALYELSRHPDFQTKVREEIKATRAQAAQRGDSELTVTDLDGMKTLVALMKETLRFHPIINVLVRMAGRDDVIPLATSQKTKTGETITSIPVSKGQQIHISISAYNRLKSVWGDDADQWRPERFIEGVEGMQKTNLGVIANVYVNANLDMGFSATFSSGQRSCIGWRFAMIEMQAILIELLESFEFSPPPGNIEILRGAAGIMTPMVKNSKSRLTALPITITPISN